MSTVEKLAEIINLIENIKKKAGNMQNWIIKKFAANLLQMTKLKNIKMLCNVLGIVQMIQL